MTSIRLNKYLSSLGIASRRKVDDLTIQNRIQINNRRAVLGDKVNPETDTVTVDKKIIPPTPATLVYYLLNKPKYVLSTTTDDHGRKTVLDIVPPSPRVYPVGRLDFESTGLIILSNDGDLALKLTHPRFHLPKTYLVSVIGKITPITLSQIKYGVELDDGKTAPADVENLPEKYGQKQLKITLYEGKKRQIRRMCAALHLHVVELVRISIGDLTLGDLPVGKYRSLTTVELNNLHQYEKQTNNKKNYRKFN